VSWEQFLPKGMEVERIMATRKMLQILKILNYKMNKHRPEAKS